ncbi:hypothetical protein FF2_003043 [Malus domestica]
MRTASFTFLQSHTNQRYLRTYTFPNYDDLIIVFGNGIVVGNNSVELGEDTDARTYRGGENASARIEDYVSDGNSDTDVQSQAEKDDYTSFFLYTIWSMLKQNSLKEGELEKIMKQIVPQVRPSLQQLYLKKFYVGMNSIEATANGARGMHSLMEKRERGR